MENTTSDQELYQSKKEAKRKHRKRARIFRLSRFYLLIFSGLVVFGFGLYWLAGILGPQGEDFSRAVPVMEDRTHIPVGESEFVTYNSNPPTSGPHYDQTARSGFRTEEISDGHIIHNLEHGDIWISYRPGVSEEVKDQLRQFGSAKVIITPRSDNETDIALAAWGRLDVFDLEDDLVPEQRIEDFIKRYIGRGPERVPGASGGI